MSKMGNLVECLTKCLLKNGMIDQSQQEIYEYGLERLINKTVSYIVLFLIAIMLKMVVPSILFLYFFFALRGRTGGYHASTKLRCFAGTLMIYVICMKGLLPLLEQHIEVAIMCMLLSAIVIFLLAPVNHPNLDFSLEEMNFYKNRVRLVLLGELIIICIFCVIGARAEYIISAILGMIVCAFLLCIAKITKQEVTSNEGQ